MSRWVILSLFVAAACSKSAGPQSDKGAAAPEGGDRIAVPGADKGPPPGGPGMAKGAEVASAGGGDQFRLKPEEGVLSIEVPPDAKAGTEVIAKVLVTPAGPYKINKEFPTKLTLTKQDGVTLAKDEMKAGGSDQVKGDAEAFDDKQLAFAVKLTPTAGNHTISGTFKFAVCDKDTCLAKKEEISIAVAAK